MRAIYKLFLIPFIFLLIPLFNNSFGEVSEQLSGEVPMIQISSEKKPSTIKKTSSERKTKKDFCDAVNHKFMQFGWHKIICDPNRWEIFNYSFRGNPIVYQEFGFDDPGNKGPVNLIFCGVHGDEPTGIYPCFYLVRDILFDNPQALKDFRMVIAPIVNPDGFFANTRQNAKGVDPNRNLPTKDWGRFAYKVWIEDEKDPRKYPGTKGGSEAESEVQIFLINKYKPDKIFSFHAPLDFLGLDFLDSDRQDYQESSHLYRTVQRAKFLGLNIEANTKKFLRFKDYRFYPGSLGNYAGNERKIPTYTVEFLTANPSEAYYYWSISRYALIKALSFDIYDGKEENPSAWIHDMSQQVVSTDSNSTLPIQYNVEN